MIPESIRDELSRRLNLAITGESRLSGGSINEAYRLESGQKTFFLKLNRSAPDNFFTKEAEGLRLLQSAQSGIILPEVFAAEQPSGDRPSFLLMEYIKPGSSGNSFSFGQQLARLHQARAPQFGLDSDNYIGSLPQRNRFHPAWSDFFISERISPLLRMAIDSGKIGHDTHAHWERLAARLDDLIPPAPPSLIHGDLWGGNYLFNSDGQAVLIDPAVYYGHPEMDLAFTHMFGGFSKEFYRGYESVSPIEPGFSDRIPIHNLYPLLVHVNLFGGHYSTQAARFLKRF